MATIHLIFIILQGISIKVVPSEFEENLDPQNFKDPDEFVIATAQGKAKEVGYITFIAQSKVL